jgi:hypothetical protein
VIPVLAETSATAGQLLIILLGSGGLLGALIAFAKLRPEKETAAMAQAQGANEVLRETLEVVERERDYWKRLYEACARRNTQLVEALGLNDRLKE